jgi:hypothetical protein
MTTGGGPLIRTLLALPFRLLAVLVAVPTNLSARLLRFSVVTTWRTSRAAVRSSIISFLLGIGVGWFLTTPTGRYATSLVVDAVRGRMASAVDDATLAERVRAAVSADTTTWHLPRPDVAVDGGVVTLTGVVPHGQGRDDLASAAARVPGVVSVVDHLTVDHVTGDDTAGHVASDDVPTGTSSGDDDATVVDATPAGSA